MRNYTESTFCPDSHYDGLPGDRNDQGDANLSLRLVQILDAEIENEAIPVIRVQWSRRPNEVLDSIEVRETSNEIGLLIAVRSLSRRAMFQRLATEVAADEVRSGYAPEGAVRVWSEVTLQEPVAGRVVIDDSYEGE